MKILGFQSGHDVSYCILDNGIPVIHEELERFIREKEPMGDGLEMALERVPKDTLNEIKHFSYGNPRGRTGDYKPRCGKEQPENEMKELLKQNKGEYFVIGHHQSHAANAFFSSNFDEALIVTIDGSGTEKRDYQEHYKEWDGSSNFFSTSFTFWEGKGNKIKPIIRIPMETLTLGSPWRVYTREIFGLSSGHPHGLAAGTIMAMASVGDHTKYYDDFRKAFIAGGGGGNDYVIANCEKYKEIVKISEEEKFNVAAAIQKATEVVAHDVMKPVIEKYKPKNICFSGGVILNSVMMGKMHDWFGIDNMYVCPVPYDGGLAIGSAQYVWHQILDNPRIKWEDDCPSYMGVTYSKEEVLEALKRDDITYSKVSDEDVLDLLDKQNIISIFHGGAESGRRALGNRSIIADPRSPKMKDLINEKVKHRQWFRPFAPSILREDVKDWFVRDTESPYMSFVLPFKEEVKDKVPAVVHLDGTGRLQTVTENNNKWYYNFIKKWKAKTGVPIILNTSFNDREPIVETPEHAVNCYMGTNIDYLYFSDYNILVRKDK
jgi:carbamoyltransferase|tara:strand:+ start:6912 stop:8552 length:1641 start_codon:yes stop_codon:yes gene_type:complete